jgi:hypothetical protein
MTLPQPQKHRLDVLAGSQRVDREIRAGAIILEEPQAASLESSLSRSQIDSIIEQDEDDVIKQLDTDSLPMRTGPRCFKSALTNTSHSDFDKNQVVLFSAGFSVPVVARWGRHCFHNGSFRAGLKGVAQWKLGRGEISSHI